MKFSIEINFKGKQLKLLSLVKLHSIRVVFHFLFTRSFLIMRSHTSWTSICFERYNELDLFTYLRYIYKVLTDLRKFEVVKCFSRYNKKKRVFNFFLSKEPGTKPKELKAFLHNSCSLKTKSSNNLM